MILDVQYSCADGSSLFELLMCVVSESFIYSASKRVKLLRLTPEPKPEIFGIAAPLGPLSTAAEKFWQLALRSSASRA